MNSTNSTTKKSSAGARLAGPEGFTTFYTRIFGERWLQLSSVLASPEECPGEARVVRENGFATTESRRALTVGLPAGPLASTYLFDRGRDLSLADESGLRAGYVMDAASVLAARALPLEGAVDILDLCAAPGGKSLILAERMGQLAQLKLCDRSSERKKRLEQVLSEYLPRAIRERISVLRMDGRRMGVLHAEAFDAILVDAPCSSEAHVLRDPRALREWSSTRSERLARDQYALLTSALLATRPGGYVLYSTCALAPAENEGVILRLLERGRHPAKVVPLDLSLGEPTRFGWRVLPDQHGAGPLCFSLLQKPPALASGQASVTCP